MSSKRGVRRRACGRKRRMTKGEAYATAKRLATIGRIGQEPYHCPFCGGWHTGKLSHTGLGLHEGAA